MVPSGSTASPLADLPAKWHARRTWRLAMGAALLLAEYLAISFAFDAQSVAKRGGIWSVLGMAGNIGPLLVVGAAAFLLVPRQNELAGSAATGSTRIRVGLLLFHGALAAAFAWVTAQAFSGEKAPPGPALGWMLVWAVLGATTAASLFVGVLGDARWLLRTLGRVVAAGGALGLAAWLGGSLSTQLWAPLSRATFLTVAALLARLGLELRLDTANSVLELEGFAVSVAPICSGFEGIGLFTVLMTGFLYQLRASLRFPRALLLLPLGLAVVWLGNVLRVASLMVLGARVDPQVALGSFHSKAGWVLFSAITLLVAAVARRSTFFARRQAPEASAALHNPAAPLLVPVLTWIGVGLATSMFSEHHDPLYGARVVVASGVLWIYRAQLRQWWQRPTKAAWLVGLLVGVGWLAVPLAASADSAAAAPLGGDWGSLEFRTWIVLRCVGAVLVVPVCEELAFRGHLARWLTQRDFSSVPFTRMSWPAIVGSSLVFGGLHDRWLLGALSGIFFAGLVRRSGRLADAVAAHAVSNAVIAVWVLATNDWRYW